MATANRIGLYARVSTRDKGQDTENQLAQLRVFCAANHWPIVAEFVEHATGKRSDREQFKRMFTAASRREFDFLVTWALDRLSREGVAKTFEHIKQLRGYGVQDISYSEPHFRTTGPAGELMIADAAWIAEQEHQRISERVRAGLEKARRQGRIGGRRRLGARLRPACRSRRERTHDARDRRGNGRLAGLRLPRAQGAPAYAGTDVRRLKL
jgi:DNA invertase Pin-like site-specific DNA recombinase